MKHNKIEEFNKLTLRRKVRSTLSVSSIGGKNKKIQIEVRKKRIYVKCTIPQEINDDINTIKNVVDFKVSDGMGSNEIITPRSLVIKKEVNVSANIDSSLPACKKK